MLNTDNNIKRNVWGLVSLLLLISFICIFLILFISFTSWLYTYNVLTKEETIGELYISKKIFRDGLESSNVKLVFYEKNNDLLFFNNKVKRVEYNFIIYGDLVFLDANFIRWQNWLKFLNISPIYKIYRIKSDYADTGKSQSAKRSVYDLNGGYDSIYDLYNSEFKEFMKLFVQSVSVSSVGQKVFDVDQKYFIKITNDSIVLESM